jgi:hypothetical protein
MTRRGFRLQASGFRLGLVCLGVIGGVARAEVNVDWGRGLVTAEGVGVADRHAPNPSVARGTSRRGAEDVARKQIAERLKELPLAGGGKVGDKLDKAAKARLARAVEDAIALEAEPETDGAWRVTMAVPIEAVRLALVGPRTLGDKGDAGPAVIVLDGVAGKPAVGWQVNGQSAATLFAADVPPWAKSAPHAAIKRVKSGNLEVPGIDATAATLFVVIAP